MNKKSQKILWIALAAAIVLGVLWQFYPLESAQPRLAKLPLNSLEYRGIDVPLTPFEQEFFEGVQVLKRLYHIDGQNFFVTVLDGTRNRHVVHDPYYCFKGAGWDVISEKTFSMKNGDASLIRIKKDGRVKEALYWFSNGKGQYNSPLKYWWQTTARRLSMGLSGPEPVLVMIQPIGEKSVDWNQVLKAIPGIQKI